VCAIQAKAQKSKRFYIGVGTGHTSFQDVKFSKVRYGGFSGSFEMGFERITGKSLWNIGILGISSSEHPSTHSATDAGTFNVNIKFGYLRKVKDNLFIGATWDVFDFYNKSFEGLGNNGTYQILSSNLFASGKYTWNDFTFGVDLGLLSFTNESTGFAFSAPQDVTAGGKFSYQDDNLTNPFSFKYGFFNFINKQLNLRTTITYKLSDRLTLSYQWKMRRFARVKDYPVTYGSNTVSLRYNFGR
jgi:hypothetical protein